MDAPVAAVTETQEVRLSRTGKRLPRTAWKPGQSGNPGGRPKEVAHVRELARQHTAEAIATLVDIMRHGTSDRARVAAAEALLNRAWGHPTTPVEAELKGEGLAAVLKPEDIRRLEETLQQLQKYRAYQRNDGSPHSAS